MAYVSTSLKWLLSIMMVVTFIFYSFCWNSFFSTGVDFTEIVVGLKGRTLWGLFFRSAGSCLGALIALFLYNYLNRESTYAVFLIFMGLGSIIIPHLHGMWEHQLLSVIIGITVGVVEVGGNMTLMTLWREKSGPFMQTISFFWTIAAAITPLIFEPFLSPSEKSKSRDGGNSTLSPAETTAVATAVTMTGTEVVTMPSIQPTGKEEIKTQIWIPYAAIGLTLVISGFLVLIIPIYLKFTTKKPEKPNVLEIEMEKKPEKVLQQPVQSKTEKYTSRAYASLACCLLFIFYGFSDLTWQSWILFIEHTSLGLDKAYAVRMLFVMNLCFAFTNFAAIFVSMKVKPFIMLSFLTSFIITGNALHLFFANTSLVLLWAGAVIESMGFASFYACTFLLMETNLPNGVTDTVGSLLVFSAWLANACGYSLVVGYFIERQPMALIYTNLGSSGVIVLILVGMFALSRLKDQRQSFKEVPQKVAEN